MLQKINRALNKNKDGYENEEENQNTKGDAQFIQLGICSGCCFL